MKKIIAGVVVILALAGLGMPFVSGLIMEKGFKKGIHDFNAIYAETGTGVSLEIISYSRSFASSEVEWKVNLGSLKSVYGVQDIVFTDRAKHGYTGVISKTSFEKNSWFTAFVNDKLGGVNPFDITTGYSLTGDIHSVLSLNTFSLTVENETLEVKPAEFVFDFDWKMDRFRTSGSWQGAGVVGKADIKGISFDSDLKMFSSFIWDGKASFQVEDIQAHEGDQTVVDMQKLKAQYDLRFDEVKNTLAVEATYGFALISDGTEKVENASITMGVRGVDGAAYEEAMRLYIEMVGALLSEVAKVQDEPEALNRVIEEQIVAAGFQLMAVYEKFLKGGMEIYVRDLHAAMPQGDVTGDVVLRLEKDLTMAQMFPMMNQPEMIFEYISIHSNLLLPKELVGDNPMLLSPVYPGMKTGFFVEDGTNLRHKGETKDKKLFINGEELLFN
jgi:uncharacterized protein YdgA (DUF945 family)